MLPPLRRRSEDILVLAESFRNAYSDLFGRNRARLTSGLSAFFLTYAWPGNIDELDLAIKTLVATADEGVVMEALHASALYKPEDTSDRVVPLKKAARAASQNAERELICNVLERTDWNRKRAARELQISYKALLYKIKQIGLDEQDRSGLNAAYNEE
jgi:two-component system response regulator AtoC